MNYPDELPDGYLWMAVPVSQREFDRLRGLANFTGEGYAWAALRQELLGWQPTPYGLKAELKRQEKAVRTLPNPAAKENFTHDIADWDGWTEEKDG